MNRKRPQDERHRLTSAIQTLNTRWARRALSLWQGHPPDDSPEQIYAGFEDDPDAGNHCRGRREPGTIRPGRGSVTDLIDHYLQRKLMPHETEMQAWSRGAAAHVDGEKIYFTEVIPWCQKSSTLLKRQRLQQETGPLCKLLKPFAVNYWTIVLETLTDELGFDELHRLLQPEKGDRLPPALPGDENPDRADGRFLFCRHGSLEPPTLQPTAERPFPV